MKKYIEGSYTEHTTGEMNAAYDRASEMVSDIAADIHSMTDPKGPDADRWMSSPSEFVYSTANAIIRKLNEAKAIMDEYYAEYEN